MIQSFNKLLACTPFLVRSVEASVKGGFATVKNKITLNELVVIFGNDEIPTGSKVYVKADQINAQYVKEVFEMGEVKFILVPQEQVKLVELAVPPLTVKYTVQTPAHALGCVASTSRGICECCVKY